MNTYVVFVEMSPRKGKRMVAVQSKRSGAELGGIAWHPGWGQYVFIPNGETIWSEDCLAAVRDKIVALTESAR